jgi:Flp pilus assembly protein TadG
MMRRSTGQMRCLRVRECKLRVQGSDMPGCACREHGSALVEFALSATILLALVFGVLAMCMALYTYHFISEAAREGTRYAMVRGSSCATYSNFTSACPASAAQIQTYVQDLNFPGIIPNNMSVATTWPTTGSSCTPSVTPCNNPGNLVQVTVTYTFPLSLPFVTTRSLTMTSSSRTVIAD